MCFISDILLYNVNTLFSSYINMRYGCNSFGNRFRQDAAIIKNFAFVCTVIVKYWLFLKIRYINIIVNNGIFACFLLFVILLNADQKCLIHMDCWNVISLECVIRVLRRLAFDDEVYKKKNGKFFFNNGMK